MKRTARGKDASAALAAPAATAAAAPQRGYDNPATTEEQYTKKSRRGKRRRNATGRRAGGDVAAGRLFAAMVAAVVLAFERYGRRVLLPWVLNAWSMAAPSVASGAWGQVWATLHTAMVNLLSVETLAAYAACAFGDPGTTDDMRRARGRLATCVLPSIAAQDAGSDGDDGDGAELRMCRYCWVWKGGRDEVHHCSTCGRCVAGMDHHCSFTASCVGRDNMRAFLLFLLWTSLSTAYAAAMLLSGGLGLAFTGNGLSGISSNKGVSEFPMLLPGGAAFCFAAAVCVSVATLLHTHLEQQARGLSTLAVLAGAHPSDDGTGDMLEALRAHVAPRGGHFGWAAALLPFRECVAACGRAKRPA